MSILLHFMVQRKLHSMGRTHGFYTVGESIKIKVHEYSTLLAIIHVNDFSNIIFRGRFITYFYIKVWILNVILFFCAISEFIDLFHGFIFCRVEWVNNIFQFVHIFWGNVQALIYPSENLNMKKDY